MAQIDWAQEFDESAVFLDLCATSCASRRIRTFFLVTALRRRFDAFLVRCGVPGRFLLCDFVPPTKFDPVQLMAVRGVLVQFVTGAVPRGQTDERVLAFFDMPMPPGDARDLVDYLRRELDWLAGNPTKVQIAANGITGMIESQRQDYAYRTAYGWPDKPCPWGGDDPDLPTGHCSVSPS